MVSFFCIWSETGWRQRRIYGIDGAQIWTYYIFRKLNTVLFNKLHNLIECKIACCFDDGKAKKKQFWFFFFFKIHNWQLQPIAPIALEEGNEKNFVDNLVDEKKFLNNFFSTCVHLYRVDDEMLQLSHWPQHKRDYFSSYGLQNGKLELVTKK